MLTKRLEMTFQTAGGGKTSVSIADPLDTLTAVDVETVMNTIISKNIFSTSTGDLSAILGARIVSRDVEDLIVV